MTGALFLDIDGTIAPIARRNGWMDWTVHVTEGQGAILWSPALAAALRTLPARIVFCTNWFADADELAPLLDLPAGEWLSDPGVTGDNWWKPAAMKLWLENHPDVTRWAFLDDEIDHRDPGYEQLRTVADAMPQRGVLVRQPPDGIDRTLMAEVSAFFAGAPTSSARPA